MTPEEQQAFVDVISNSLTQADIAGIEVRAFEVEAVAVAKELTTFCDHIAKYFDPEVVVAALEMVLNDYDSLEADEDK